MRYNVFAYGSLMFDDIMQELLDQRLMKTDAILNGWSRHALRDRSYPGAVADCNDQAFVQGIVWFNLSEADLAILDHFEGDEYSRQEVTVVTQDGQTVQAWVYAWKDKGDLLGPWDPDLFEQTSRSTFVQIHRPYSP